MTPCLGTMNTNNSTDLNNDEAFLALLSAQRELLNRMNMESGTRRGKQTRNIGTSSEMGRDSVIGPIDPFSLMNSPPIVEQRSNMDFLFSQRLSNFGAGDAFGMPPPTSSLTQEEKIREYDFKDPRMMKRRRSSFGLQPELFDEQQRLAPMYRRLSMMSTVSSLTGFAAENFDLEFANGNFEPEPVPSIPKSVQLDPNIRPETIQKNLLAFVSSMQKSTESQQDIHAWDRKMGLKRSHSKTMRLTMRSRKKLRTILKRDINSLSSLSLR